MMCAICRVGETFPQTTTATFQRGETTVIIKAVPADVCDACGEQYYSEAVTKQLLALAEGAVARGAEVEILRWAA